MAFKSFEHSSEKYQKEPPKKKHTEKHIQIWCKNHLKPHTNTKFMIIIVYYLCLVRKKRPKEIKIEESTDKKCGALKWKLEIKYFGVTLFEMPNVFLTSNISVEQEPKKKHMNGTKSKIMVFLLSLWMRTRNHCIIIVALAIECWLNFVRTITVNHID